MTDDASFGDLILRVRAGDDRAAAELVRGDEEPIRRTIRARLRQARLRRLLDSTDICQAVLASFFVRVALGRYDLERAEDLLRLLTAMAHHKLTNELQKQQADRRDYRRIDARPVESWNLASDDSTPGGHAAGRELLAEARRRLSPEEQRLLELRGEGRSWAEVAKAVGGEPEALRKKLERAIDRVTKKLGLLEVPHE